MSRKTHPVLKWSIFLFLQKSAPSRIINVTSTIHKTGKINTEDLNSDKKYDGSKAYSQSKLANVLFTQELARRLDGNDSS